MAIEERLRGIRFIIRDRDSKYSGPFDEVFRTEGVKLVKTPIRAIVVHLPLETFLRHLDYQMRASGPTASPEGERLR